MTRKIRASGGPRPEPIAIVGIGCRLPGNANDPESFWKLMVSGVDAVTEVPSDRWNAKKFYDPEPGLPGKAYSKWGAFLEGIDRFEPEAFGISPREAVYMDPQQRLLLEVAWEAIEDGGDAVERLSGTKTGVFVGISHMDYAQLQANPFELTAVDPHAATGNAGSIAPARVAYCFNLVGPCMAVDTACSSSLVAVHLACKSLWSGECEQALAGGVNAIFTPNLHISFCAAGMLSAEGRCKAFDASADGFVRGEGAGLVYLKPLSRALADGNPVHAVITATAVNQDGRTTGISAPGEASQAMLLAEAYDRAGIVPADIAFVEAHGTGTEVGDPIEARALGSVLSRGRSESTPCLIGSVKTNIGHLEAAAGIAGLIKATLALEHRAYPGNLHFKTPNPAIPFDDLRLRVPVETTALNGKGRLHAGVNSFGFGGTNAHVVLREHRAAKHGGNGAPVEAVPELLLPLSARTPEALRERATTFSEFVTTGPGADLDLADVCYTARERRGHLEHRLAVAFGTRVELAERLAAFGRGEKAAGTALGRRVSGRAPRVAFLYPGQGPQWRGMGRELLKANRVFRETIEACDAFVRRFGGWSLLDELHATEEASRFHETRVAQPAIVAIQAALTAVWRSWGVEPAAVSGHSVGEVAAAHAAGILDLEETMRLIIHRSACMDVPSSRGRMLAVGLSLEEAEALVSAHPGRVSVAAHNGPRSVTLSGDPETLQTLERALDEAGTFCKFLRVEYAFHGPFMEPVKEPFLANAVALAGGSATVPIVSTVTGKLEDPERFDAAHWWRNVREHVRFAEAMSWFIDEGFDAFVEVSPHPALASSVLECYQARGKTCTVLPSLRREEPELTTLLVSLGGLHAAGHPVAWRKLWPEGTCVRLPGATWRREIYWHAAHTVVEGLRSDEHPLLGRNLGFAEPTWFGNINKRSLRFLEDHRLSDKALFPGAGYVEMALSAGRAALGGGPLVLEDVQFQNFLFLNDGKLPPRVQTVLKPEDASFTIHSRTDDSWVQHAVGYARALADFSEETIDVAALKLRHPRAVDLDAFYGDRPEGGLIHGPAFQGLVEARVGKGEALGLVEAPASIAASVADYAIHPALLDACFQVTPMIALGTDRSWGGRTLIPVRMGRVRWFREPGAKFWVHARLTASNPSMIEGDFRVFTEDGVLAMAVEGFRYLAVEAAGRGASRNVDAWLYRDRWIGRALPERASGPVPVDFVPEAQEISDAIQAEIGWMLRKRGEMSEGRNTLHALSTFYVARAFRTMGWAYEPGGEFTVEEVNVALGTHPRHHRVVGSLLRALEASGILERSGETWRARCPLPDKDPEALWREALFRFPSLLADLNLIRAAGGSLARSLRGEVDALELLFPDGSSANMEHLYQDSPNFRLYNTAVQLCLAEAVKELPPGRPLRVLEVGAGTGGLTAYVLRELPEDRTTYVYTDVSPAFFPRAEQRFRPFPFLSCRTFDVEKDPVAQGYEAHAYDVVLASDVLHASRDLRESLRNIRKLLAPSGVFLFLEVEGAVPWLDMTFGLMEGWWRFQDKDLRPDHPLLPRAAWKRVLEEAGFRDVWDVVEEPASRASQMVLWARAPQFIPEMQEANGDKHVEPHAGTWILFEDASGAAGRLQSLLEGDGRRCVRVTHGNAFERLGDDAFRVDPGDPAHLTEVVKAALAGEGPFEGAVHLWSLDAPSIDSLDALHRTEALGAVSAMHLLQAIAREDLPGPSRVVLVTRRALPVGDGMVDGFAQAAVIGLGRTANSELPGVRCKIVDLGDPGSEDEIASLHAETLTVDPDEEVVLRGLARFVPRAETAKPFSVYSERGSEGNDCRNRPYGLSLPRTGVIDHLTLREIERRPPGPGEVEIEAYAASLNFRDVLKTMGLYPPDGGDALILGDECAGRIAALGEDVTGFRVGDPVIAIGPGCFASHVTTQASVVMPLPEGMTFENGATIPIPYLTAYYSLVKLAGLQKGESVLIHAATGGVGLAALHIAKDLGAEIFATAGNPEKREFLRALGVRHVLDSRSLEFSDRILAITGGRGVDVVLNSLAGQAIAKGIACLAPFGRFLELGKRDIHQNSKLGLWGFRKNQSFFAIDLGAVTGDRAALASEILGEVFDRFASGAYPPLPHRSFPMTRVHDAFRTMAQAKHVGKVVLAMNERRVRVEPLEKRVPASFRSDATYLITGGFGGLGRTLAAWLVERGARNLVLLSRSGAESEEARRFLEELRAKGARADAIAADVARAEDVTAALARIDAEFPPLRGVFHLAMVLDDGILANLDAKRFHAVMAPKADGAWNLHDGTIGRDLDCFVLFSSISSVIGAQGQANYAAANAVLDALAHHRRASGLPAVTINWGHVAEVGYVAQHAEVAAFLERRGLHGLTPDGAMETLELLLQRNAPQTSVVRADWERWARSASIESSQRMLPLIARYLANDESNDEAGRLRQHILQAPEDERLGMVESYVAAQVAKVLGTSAASIDVEQPLNELGLDSLMAVELKNRIETDLGIALPARELMQSPTIAKLSPIVLDQLGGGGASRKRSTAETPASAAPARCLVPLRDGGSRLPLYCFHPGGGSVSVYRTFAERLPDDLPVLGIQSRLLAGDTEEHPTLDAMAQAYVEAIRLRQPEGPYHLFGYSLGGLTAMAVARLLEDAGSPVGFLGLVETEIGGIDENDPGLVQRRVMEMVEVMQGMLPGVEPVPTEILEETVAAFAESFLPATPEERLALVESWLEEQEIVSGDESKDIVRDAIGVFFAHWRITKGFTPSVVKAPVHVWRAREGNAPSIAEGPWKACFPNLVVEDKVPGSHFGVMKPPQVDTLAERVAEAMGEMQIQGSRA